MGPKWCTPWESDEVSVSDCGESEESDSSISPRKRTPVAMRSVEDDATECDFLLAKGTGSSSSRDLATIPCGM